MKRRFTILSAALALLLVAPSMMGWGQTRTEEVYSTCLFGTDYNQASVQNYTTTWTAKNGSFLWTIVNGNNNQNSWNYIKFGRKNYVSVGEIKTNAAYNEAITKVVLTIDAITIDKINSIKLYTSTNNSTWTAAGSFTKATGAQTVSLVTPATGLYYKIEFDCASGSSNGLVQVSKIEYYHNAGVNYTITVQSNNTEYGAVSLSGTVITGTPADGCRFANPAYTVDPANSATVAQEGNEFTVTPSANTTVTINFEPVPTHTATFSVNGTTTTQTFTEGAVITFPTAPSVISGKTFVGWTTAPIAGTTNNAPEMVTSATMGTNDVTFYAVFADETPGATQNASNTITPDTENIPGSYGTANTFSEYSLNGVNFMIQQMYKYGQKLQWRAAGNTNGTGTMYNSDALLHIQSVVLTYDNSDSNKNFTLNVGDAANPTNGTAITPTANGLVYTFDCSSYNKNYFVLTNGSGAGYLSQIVINYLTGTPATYSNYCTTVEMAAVEMPVIAVAQNPFEFSTTVTITCATEGATIYYTTDGNDSTTNSNVYSESFTINSTTIIKAMAVKGSDESTIAEVTAVKVLATPTVEISSLNIFINGTTTVTTDGPALTLTTSDASIASVSGTSVTGVAAGTATITATWSANNDFSAGTKDFEVVVTDPNTGTINFGNIGTNIDEASVTGDDSNRNTWTITTEGTTSFTQTTYYSQVGSSKDPALSITFTTTLPNSVKITAFSAQFGGFNGTVGDVTLKVGETIVGTGNLSGANDVTVTSTSSATGTVLTVIVTNIDKGVKCYSISYTFVYQLDVLGYAAGSAGGYRLIASPVSVSPADVEGMILTGENAVKYDLFYFDQSNTNEGAYLEWVNYKSGNHPEFDLVPGKGYLYAQQATTEGEVFHFTLSGSPYTGNGIIPLDYDASARFAGWNLIGNPYATAATLDKPFYKMDANGVGFGVEIEDLTNTIAAMEGVFVQVNATGQSAKFTPQRQSNQPASIAYANIVVNDKKGSVLDNAIVRFDNGETLGKFQLNRNSTKVYFSENNNDYAIVRGEEMGAMPVNFKAENNGTYSLNVSGQNTEFAYLHLIDNMTGNDVDLLQTPSYSFEAKTTDYESRFKLVFATGDNSNDDTFAFYSNGSFVINNEGNAELQVIDIMGRIVKSESINGCTNVNVNAAPGVYMLRLINGDNVKTQKVVVK